MAGKYRDTWYNVCKYGLSLLPEQLFHNAIGYIMHRRFKCKYTWMNIKHPVTFSEKLQYLKTHPACNNEAVLADKYDVREFIKETIGEEYLVPILGVWDDANEIDFDKLPNEFVIKLTKGSGYNLIVPNKRDLNIADTKKKLNQWLKVNPYYMSREPQYKGTNRLVCEQMLEYNITDYKFFCFNGVPEYVELYMDRFGDHKKLFYDMDWNKMPFTTAGDVCNEQVECPEMFAAMREIAAKLSTGMSFVRVDLYIHDNKIYFGELTFHPAGGYTPITPREWDYKLGDMIKL